MAPSVDPGHGPWSWPLVMAHWSWPLIMAHCSWPLVWPLVMAHWSWPLVMAHWSWPLVMAHWSWPLVMAHWSWPLVWPLVMAPNHGPLVMAPSHGPLVMAHWSWPLVMAHWSWPLVWPLVMAPGHGPWSWPLVWPLVMAPSHGPLVMAPSHGPLVMAPSHGPLVMAPSVAPDVVPQCVDACGCVRVLPVDIQDIQGRIDHLIQIKDSPRSRGRDELPAPYGIDGHRTLGDKSGLAGKRDAAQEEDVRTELQHEHGCGAPLAVAESRPHQEQLPVAPPAAFCLFKRSSASVKLWTLTPVMFLPGALRIADGDVIHTLLDFLSYLKLKDMGALDSLPSSVTSEELNP
ncbi:Galanin peptide [Takifugu flavidus]|uniref:Galanin peptides n=1 Tax=Takifugu flavidus TaxID=433684 RepID=A0A5C6P8K1_9TELE|nr:Galanin peptide [Takifugu flavidus]